METRRRIIGLTVIAAAVALTIASTAYACVNIKGDATVTGSVRTGNLITGNGLHDYCAGRTPVTAAAGPAGSQVSATFAKSTAPVTSSCPSTQLPDGEYDVRLRNSNAGYEGVDGTGWTQVPLSGCFIVPVGANNHDIGDMTINSGTGSGGGTWNLPGVLVPNGPTDSSIFCVGKKNASGVASGNSDGFLAPFRVSTL